MAPHPIRPTLAAILDSTSFAVFDLEKEGFSDSCFIVEELLREKLPETEVPDGREIATNVRVLVGTYREGSIPITVPTGSTIRQALQQFATVWEVAVLVNKNTVLMVERFDAERYPHDTVILPRAKPPDNDKSDTKT